MAAGAGPPYRQEAHGEKGFTAEGAENAETERRKECGWNGRQDVRHYVEASVGATGEPFFATNAKSPYIPL
jgi:hypothetical protein